MARIDSWKDWLIAAMFTLIVAVGGYAIDAIDKRMTAGENRINSIELVVNSRAERIKALEVKSDVTEKTLAEINQKLDMLIQMHIQK